MGNRFDKALIAYNRGDYQTAIATLSKLAGKGRLDEAALGVLGTSYYKLGDLRAAAATYAQIGKAKLADDPAHFLKIAFTLYRKLEDAEKAVDVAEKLLAVEPHNAEVAEFYLTFTRKLIQLKRKDALHERIMRDVATGSDFWLKVERPWRALIWSEDEAFNLKVAQHSEFGGFTDAQRTARRALPLREPEKRIGVGYLSNDFFSQHAMMSLIRGMLESHDEERFDIQLFSYTPEDQLATKDDGFHSNDKRLTTITHMRDDEAAELIRSRNLDILIDLKGMTTGARTNLVNKGLAPIQAAYMGFPGSGPQFDCDYIISDRVITPDSAIPNFAETLCRLPETYFVIDNIHRALPDGRASRTAHGLPEDAFVFACLNQLHKLSTQTMELWSRIAKAVPDSVFWLWAAEEDEKHYAELTFREFGIDPSRIVFAPSLYKKYHLARLPLADIALDNLPCNGHTTTSDLLWAGVPVITRKGTTFASRVSESILNAIGLPDLVAEDSEGYVERAIHYATNPQALSELRQRLADNRTTEPLFDTERFTRHMEKAFEMMVERKRAGLEPDVIDVPALPPRNGAFQIGVSPEPKETPAPKANEGGWAIQGARLAG